MLSDSICLQTVGYLCVSNLCALLAGSLNTPQTRQDGVRIKTSAGSEM